MSELSEVIKHSVSRIVEYMDEKLTDDETFNAGVNLGLYIALSILHNDIDCLCEEGTLEKVGLDFDVDSLLGK